MKLYVILATVVIIFVYIVISCRHYIKAYLKYLKGNLKYKKDVNNSLKVDLKTRKLSNEEVKYFIKYLANEFEKIEYTYKGEYIVSDNLKRELIYSKFSERTLKKLFYSITEHLGITNEGVELEVKNISSRTQKSYAGLYHEGINTAEKKIILLIKPDYSFETVLSILIHESMHYFLFTNGIKLEDNTKNEYLTDIATIYLGFGKYMLEGYKTSKKIVFLDEYKRTTSSYKVGYLNYSDVKYTKKQIRRYRA